MKRTLILTASLLLAGLGTTALPAADKKVKAKPGHGGLEREFQELLQHCDKDKDGAVSKDEFTKNQPAGKDPGKTAEWFAKKDTNKDDKLTHEEFVPPPGKK